MADDKAKYWKAKTEAERYELTSLMVQLQEAGIDPKQLLLEGLAKHEGRAP